MAANSLMRPQRRSIYNKTSTLIFSKPAKSKQNDILTYQSIVLHSKEIVFVDLKTDDRRIFLSCHINL